MIVLLTQRQPQPQITANSIDEHQVTAISVSAREKGAQMPLKLGMFLTPASNPTRPMSEIIDWNIDVIRKAEEHGYDEVWVGSHLTSHYSPIACPTPGDRPRNRRDQPDQARHRRRRALPEPSADHCCAACPARSHGAGSDQFRIRRRRHRERQDHVRRRWCHQPRHDDRRRSRSSSNPGARPARASSTASTGRFIRRSMPFRAAITAGIIGPTHPTSRVSRLPAASGRGRRCCGSPASTVAFR